MKNIIFTLLIFIFTSCAGNDTNIDVTSSTSCGNIQNGGYIVKYKDKYIYANPDDYNNLYESRNDTDNGEKLSGGHFFCEMNLCNDEIYYISSYPGEVWSISLKDFSKKRLINRKVGNLIIYDNHMYYRLSEDNDWGKLYRSDLNGKNKKLLSKRVNKFCIYDGTIYYSDIENSAAVSSMNIDGTNAAVINNVYAGNIFVMGGALIYSDHNRGDKLYSYDLHTGKEKCISEDMCWNINCNRERIFYRNQSDGGSLYCIRRDGSSKQKLADGNITDIVVMENDIFYKDIDRQNKIECFKFNE